jgi:hypothetical protein
VTIRELGFNSRREQKIFSSLRSPDWLMGPPIFLFYKYWGHFTRGETGWGCRTTTHLRLVKNFKIRGDAPPLPYTYFDRALKIKHRDNFYVILFVFPPHIFSRSSRNINFTSLIQHDTTSAMNTIEWTLLSSGMWRLTVRYNFTDFSEELAASTASHPGLK